MREKRSRWMHAKGSDEECEKNAAENSKTLKTGKKSWKVLCSVTATRFVHGVTAQTTTFAWNMKSYIN